MFLTFLKVAVGIPGENDEVAEFLNPVVSHPCRSLAHLFALLYPSETCGRLDIVDS